MERYEETVFQLGGNGRQKKEYENICQKLKNFVYTQKFLSGGGWLGVCGAQDHTTTPYFRPGDR